MIDARRRRGTAIDARTEDMPLRVLGIDPGTLHTGWGIVERTRRGLVYRAAGVLSPRATFGLGERLRRIHEGLAAVIREWQPHVVSLEKAFMARNAQSALRLGEARGIVLLAAAQAGLPLAEYNPTEIKTAVTGYGRAGKVQIQKAVMGQLVRVSGSADEIPASPDATDALAAAVCHCGAARVPEALSRARIPGRQRRTSRPRRLADVAAAAMAARAHPS